MTCELGLDPVVSASVHAPKEQKSMNTKSSVRVMAKMGTHRF